MTAILLICIAILAGSFPSGVVLSRLILGRDVREIGSGNIGAANAARAGGIKLGAGVGLLDILKGLLPVLLARWVGLDSASLAIVGVAAVLGHDFSIFLHFRGGKGVATTLGVALGLSPLATALAAICWLVVVLLSGYTSLASLVALALLPMFLVAAHQPAIYVVAAIALLILAAFKHLENIARLLAGTERSFRRPATSSD
jgi:glycerol-3-phosphate acyltransferase PlsY